jgi:hypothetical protein
MTETMFDRAVKAIESEIGKQEMVLTNPLTLRRMMAERAARAALDAIREPDDAMVKLCWWGDSDVAEWVSGVDAILSQS